MREKGLLRYTFSRNGEPFRTFTRDVSENLSLPVFYETWLLEDFPPAHYELRVVLEIDGREIISSKEEFDLSHQEAVPRPWYYRRIFPGSSHPLFSAIIGSQHYRLGRPQKALSYLEKAYTAQPGDFGAALNLAWCLFDLARYTRTVEVLKPFTGKGEDAQYEAFVWSGRALRKSGRGSEAIQMLDRAIQKFGVNTQLLNVMGHIYAELGREKDAADVWEKSIEIDPHQPDIQQKLKGIKK